MGPIVMGARGDVDRFTELGRFSEMEFYHGFEYLYNMLVKNDPKFSEKENR